MQNDAEASITVGRGGADISDSFGLGGGNVERIKAECRADCQRP